MIMANIKVAILGIASALISIILSFVWIISVLIAVLTVYGDANKTPVIINTVNLWTVGMWAALGMIVIIIILTHMAFMFVGLRGRERKDIIAGDIGYLKMAVLGFLLWFIGLIVIGILNITTDAFVVVLPGYAVMIICIAPKLSVFFR